MNGYKAFYKGKSLGVYAETSYEAQCKAAVQFKAKKPYEVTVMLCETGVQNGAGQQYTHSSGAL